MSVRINTLPGMRVMSPPGDTGVLVGRRVPQALLVYLAIERSASRDTLMALLWPERDDERARHSLSQALYELRARLGEDCIDATAEMVAIGAVVETDLARFEAAVEAGRWAEALELYGGDFLDGAYLAPTHAFEEWVDRRRAQLARLHRRARRELVAQRLSAGDLAGALVVAERWAEVAPLDDEAQMRAVELLARTGRRAEALQHYERFRELLRAEQLEPMPDLARLASDIVAGRLQPATPMPLVPPTAAVPPATVATPAPAAVTEPSATPAAGSTPEPAGSPAPLATRSAAAPSASTAAPNGSRAGREVLAGALVGVIIGSATALLAARLLPSVLPELAPPTPSRFVFAVAAVLLVGAAVAWWMRVGGSSARRARVARAPSRGLGAGLGFALGFLVALSLAYTLAPLPASDTAGAPRWNSGAWVVRIAVTRFANRAGDPALEPIGRMAEDWVTRKLRSIPEALVVAAAPSTPADTSARAVAELARRTGAQAVLFGSYYSEGTDVLLVARLVPVQKILPSEVALQPIGPVRTPRDRPLTGVERLAALVAGAVAAGCRAPECAPGREPPTYEARAAWLDALAANKERNDVQAARNGFRRAIALDSAFANAYTGLANSYLLSGDCARVDSIGDVMESRRTDFARYDLLYMRAMRATCRGDLDAAYQYRTEAVHIAPDNAGALWGAAEAAAAAGRLNEAELRLAAMANTWYWNEFYYYTLYTEVLHLRGKIAEELRLADTARARLSDAAYRFDLGVPGLAALGRTTEIEARFAEARNSRMRYVPLARLYGDAALELEWHHHPQAAREFTARALQELERATPPERRSMEYRVRRAELLIQARRWREARQILNALSNDDLAHLRQQARLTPAYVLAERGIAAARTGDPATARAALAAIEHLPERGPLAFGSPAPEACEAAVLAALGARREALSRLADGQARGTIPRSSPKFAHAQLLLRDLWHDPDFDRMFAPRD